MQLSRYFSLDDLTRSDTAQRQGINNTPDTFSQSNLYSVAVLLDQIYDQIGAFTITSGYRSPALNAAIGGSDSSLHMRGMAADLLPQTMTAEQFFWKLAASPLRMLCGEIINEAGEKGVVHVSIPYEGGTGVLKYLSGGSYYRYSDSEIRSRLGSSAPAQYSGSSIDIPVMPIVLTAAVLGGLAFMATMKPRTA